MSPQPADIAAAKAAARKVAASRRKAAHAVHGEAASNALVRHLADLEGEIVAGYLPIRSEADPRPAMVALLRRNRVAVPVVEGPGRPLRFRAWHPDVALVEGAYRVLIPAEGDWLTPTTLIVPMLAFDAQLCRLGYGGGFYDRTLAHLRAAHSVHALGFAYAAQFTPDLPREPTDAPLDTVLTDVGPHLRGTDDAACTPATAPP